MIRGSLGGMHRVGSYTELDGVSCIGRALNKTTLSAPGVKEDPPAGEVFLFLVEYVDGTARGYGTASAVGEISIVSGDSCH